MEYVATHVKRNPETGEVAIRNVLPDTPPTDRMAWIVVGEQGVAIHASTTQVEGWDDLYTPEQGS